MAYHRIDFCCSFQLSSADDDFLQFFDALLLVLLLGTRSLQAQVSKPRAGVRHGGQLGFLLFQFSTNNVLHEFRRRLPLLFVRYVTILQGLALYHSLRTQRGKNERNRHCRDPYQRVKCFEIPLMPSAACLNYLHLQIIGDGIVGSALLLSVD